MQVLNMIASLLGIELDKVTRRLERNAIALGLILFLVIVAVVFALVAAQVALAGWIGPIWSALMIAGIALVLALCIYLGMQMARAADKRREAEREKAQDQAMTLTAIALATLPGILRSPTIRRIGIPMAVVATLVTLGLIGDRDEGGGEG